MSYIKKYGLNLIITICLILVSLILINSFYYFNLVNENVYKFLKVLTIMINIFIGSFLLGKKCTNKGYLEGMRFGLIIIALLFIPTLILSKLQFKLLLYYLVIITISTLGGTVGIRKKKKQD